MPVVDLNDLVPGTGAFPGIERRARFPAAAGFFIVNTSEPAEQAAAWKLLEFMLQPANAQAWHVSGGYLPVVKAVNDEPEVQAFWTDDLAGVLLKPAADQLDNADPDEPGPLIGPYPDFADAVEAAIEAVLLDDADPATALADARTRSPSRSNATRAVPGDPTPDPRAGGARRAMPAGLGVLTPNVSRAYGVAHPRPPRSPTGARAALCRPSACSAALAVGRGGGRRPPVWAAAVAGVAVWASTPADAAPRPPARAHRPVHPARAVAALRAGGAAGPQPLRPRPSTARPPGRCATACSEIGARVDGRASRRAG